jgi:hypothetical protein
MQCHTSNTTATRATPPADTPELVAATSFEKSLRLVISFGSLKRAQFVSALEERLKPALDKVGVVCGGVQHSCVGALCAVAPALCHSTTPTASQP